MLTNGVLWAVRLQQRLEALRTQGLAPAKNSAQSLTKARTQSGRVTAF